MDKRWLKVLKKAILPVMLMALIASVPVGAQPGGPVRLYVFTTQGHIYSGLLVDLMDEYTVLEAPDGKTLMHISLRDISVVRLYDQDAEVFE